MTLTRILSRRQLIERGCKMKQGSKHEPMTISRRAYKRQVRSRHSGGVSAVNKAPSYWVKMIDGKRWQTYMKGKFVQLVPDCPPLPKQK